MNKKAIKFTLVAVMVAVVVLGFSAVASATHLGQSHKTAHGGYSSATNKCLQCHDIHTEASLTDPDADYVLLRWPTVVDTCGSCHTLYMGGSSAYGEDYGEYTYASSLFPGEVGTGSDKQAYKVVPSQKNSHYGHRMMQGGSYIIGGSEGLTAIDIWRYGVPGNGNYYLWAPYSAEAPFTKGADKFTATNGLYCASCHTPHADFGQQLNPALGLGFNPDASTTHSNKLLSSRPNHVSNAVTVTDWAKDGYKYCLACHDQRAPDHTKGYYNHPVEVCLVCHADERSQPSYDFPHTSPNARILAQAPDGLCVGCHGAGQLP